MSERLEMQGRLAGLEQDEINLSMRADAACQTIRRALNTALVEVTDIDVAMAANEMDGLVMAHAELLGVRSRISRLRKELGLG